TCPQDRKGLSDLAALGFDETEKLGGGAAVLIGLGARVRSLQVEPLRLDGLAGDGPTSVTVGPLGPETEELLKMGESETCFLPDLGVHRRVAFPEARSAR